MKHAAKLSVAAAVLAAFSTAYAGEAAYPTKSVRIIIETIVAAITAGLGHREARRATPAETAAAAATGEVDLDKIVIPAGLKDAAEEKPVAKKRPSRTTGAKKSAVTTDEV